MRRALCYASPMILLLLACLVDTDSGAPDAPASPIESHQIVACAPYGHVFLKGHKALEMVIVDYGDREGVVPVTPLMGGLWDFACPDVPAALHVFWID